MSYELDTTKYKERDEINVMFVDKKKRLYASVAGVVKRMTESISGLVLWDSPDTIHLEDIAQRFNLPQDLDIEVTVIRRAPRVYEVGETLVTQKDFTDTPTGLVVGRYMHGNLNMILVRSTTNVFRSDRPIDVSTHPNWNGAILSKLAETPGLGFDFQVLYVPPTDYNEGQPPRLDDGEDLFALASASTDEPDTDLLLGENGDGVREAPPVFAPAVPAVPVVTTP